MYIVSTFRNNLTVNDQFYLFVIYPYVFSFLLQPFYGVVTLSNRSIYGEVSYHEPLGDVKRSI